jgi:hypothetical protein
MLSLFCWKYEKAIKMRRMIMDTTSTAQCTDTSSSFVKLLRKMISTITVMNPVSKVSRPGSFCATQSEYQDVS